MREAALALPSPLARSAARYRRNIPAIGALAALVAFFLFAFIGPFLAPLPFDRAFTSYVKAAPSLIAHPTRVEAERALHSVANRMRATLAEFEIDATRARATLTAERPIDVRLIAYFERSDAFGPATIDETSDDGRRIVVMAPLRRIPLYAGADDNGRDLLSRMMVGTRVSFIVGALGSAVALIVGVAYGAFAGFVGGRVDLVMMRLVDALYALPFIFFVILLVAFFGRRFELIFLAIGAVEWLDMARLARGQTLSLKRQEFVAAAEAMGVRPMTILTRHVAPNLMGPIAAFLAVLTPRVILLESFLSFLGLGVQEPMTSLGVLVADGARNIEDAPWLVLFPSALLSAILLAFNFVAEGLREALDPRQR